jgi:hypothetical protein
MCNLQPMHTGLNSSTPTTSPSITCVHFIVSARPDHFGRGGAYSSTWPSPLSLLSPNPSRETRGQMAAAPDRMPLPVR